ncbi:MAG: hypothetical protein IPN05_09670, partial [Sulfuritalea sp.]|nr:hypothetical protein [Sulfuritalea sp.]
AYTIAGKGDLTLSSDGSYSFVPVANWNGTVPTVTYTTNTGSSTTLAITVTPVDDASVLVADTKTVAEDNTASGNVLTNDSDVDNTLTVASFTIAGESGTFTLGSAYTIAGKGDLTLSSDGSYSFVPVANWNGTVPTVTYTTNTGSSTTLAITVTPVDDASVLVADTKTVAEDNTASGNVLTNDSDVDNTLTVASFTIAGESGTFTLGSAYTIAGKGDLTLSSDGSYSFVPVANWNGTVPTVTYTTNTGSSTTLAITVTPVDDASVLVADTKTVAEDNTASGNVLTNDSDVDNTLTVASFTIAGESGTFTLGSAYTIAGKGDLTLSSDGSYSFVPVANWNGTVPTVTYTTNTGSSTTLAITVTPVDDASVLVADTKTVAEDNTASGNGVDQRQRRGQHVDGGQLHDCRRERHLHPGQRLHHRRQGRSDAEQRRQLQLCAGSQLERHGADGDLHHQHRFEHHAGDHGDAG